MDHGKTPIEIVELFIEAIHICLDTQSEFVEILGRNPFLNNSEIREEVQTKFEGIRYDDPQAPTQLISNVLEAAEELQNATQKSVQSINKLAEIDTKLLGIKNKDGQYPFVRTVLVGYFCNHSRAHVMPQEIKVNYTLEKQKAARDCLKNVLESLQRVRETGTIRNWVASESRWLKDQQNIDETVTKRLGILECVVGAFVAINDPKAGDEIIEEGLNMIRQSTIDKDELDKKVDTMDDSFRTAEDNLIEMVTKCTENLKMVNENLDALEDKLKELVQLDKRFASLGKKPSYTLAVEIKAVPNKDLSPFAKEMEKWLTALSTSCIFYQGIPTKI